MKIKGLIKIHNSTELQKDILYFFIYSFLGWVLETIFCLVTLGEFHKRGFLYGPVCPIYGFAAIILIKTLKRVQTNFVGKFIISFVSFSAFEYAVSVILEALFGLRWWDYSNEVLNFQGRISLAYSIAWGILGVIFVQNIHPYISNKVEKVISHISNNKQKITLFILILIIIIDTVLSAIKYL